MDGFPAPKNRIWKGNYYSETRYAVIQFLEKELPLLSGNILDVGSGNWSVPKSLLNSKTTTYTTLDQKTYGSTTNHVQIIGDVQALPKDWDNKWGHILFIEALECIPNPFAAMDEIYRVLKPGGSLLFSTPWAYRWFGKGSWNEKDKGAPDYWRISPDGIKLLTKKFKSVRIDYSGPNIYDAFGFLVRVIK